METITNKKNFPEWEQDYEDYLLSNGFREVPGSETNLCFVDQYKAIMVWKDRIAFYMWTEIGNDDMEGWTKVHEFYYYGSLDIFSFMLLCHITGMVSLKKFVQASGEDAIEELKNELTLSRKDPEAYYPAY